MRRLLCLLAGLYFGVVGVGLAGSIWAFVPVAAFATALFLIVTEAP